MWNNIPIFTDLCRAKKSNTLIINTIFNEYLLMKYFFKQRVADQRIYLCAK